jgi:hypothetical protein
MTECKACADEAWPRGLHHCVHCHRGFWSRKSFGLHRAEDGTCRNPAADSGFFAVSSEFGPVWRAGVRPSAAQPRSRESARHRTRR